MSDFFEKLNIGKLIEKKLRISKKSVLKQESGKVEKKVSFSSWKKKKKVLTS